eukprot:1157205-Pelagomonas_calceolata.AAC.1
MRFPFITQSSTRTLKIRCVVGVCNESCMPVQRSRQKPSNHLRMYPTCPACSCLSYQVMLSGEIVEPLHINPTLHGCISHFPLAVSTKRQGRTTQDL